jgi:hypothetical protein
MGSCFTQIDLGVRRLKKLGGAMSDEFDRLHGIEKAAVESVLNRSRVLAAKIANELRNKRPEHFVDEFLLADIYYSLEHVADVLSTVNGSQAQGPQRHG